MYLTFKCNLVVIIFCRSYSSIYEKLNSISTPSNASKPLFLPYHHTENKIIFFIISVREHLLLYFFRHTGRRGTSWRLQLPAGRWSKNIKIKNLNKHTHYAHDFKFILLKSSLGSCHFYPSIDAGTFLVSLEEFSHPYTLYYQLHLYTKYFYSSVPALYYKTGVKVN